MNCRQRIGLLAVALSCSLDLAKAQNNLNNIEAVNGANSIDEINENSSNNSNNVLDSEELNSNNSNLNASGDTGNENDFTNNENNFSNNTLNNNSANANNTFENNNNEGNSQSANNEANSNVNVEENGSTEEQGNPVQSFSNESPDALTDAATNSSPAPLPENAAPTEPFAANSPDMLAPTNEFAPFPESGDAIPPVDAAPGLVTEIPDAQSNIENNVETEAERKAREQAEKQKQRLELARKMAENIPPLNPGEAPAEYTVQPGDTLWDISDQLLDDAMWWPRLWVLNPEIQDPDAIEPGMKILFYPSVAGEAPALVVRDNLDGFGAPKIDPLCASNI